MTYELYFHESALKEWKKLDPTIRSQFQKKLRERLVHPRVAHDALHGMQDCYKIKLRSIVYRLVYRVEDEAISVFVIAVGRRENDEIYDLAERRR